MKSRFPNLLAQMALPGAGLWLATAPVCAQSPPTLSLQLSNGAARVSLTGQIGSACTVQYKTALSPTNIWQFLTNLTPLGSSPFRISDPGAVLGARFYRAFAQTVPSNVLVTNMVWIPPGTFTMGSPESEALRYPDEAQHTVTLTKGFYLGKYLVTQGQYLSFTNSNPSYFTTNNGYALDLNRPVEQVTWGDATNYCAKLTQQQRTAARIPTNWVYRLPTETEWEYACRADTTTAFSFGDAIHGGRANFYDYYEYDAAYGDIYVANPPVPYLNRTTTLGTYAANPWGLYDMHGNLWEWCSDWYGAYPGDGTNDPQGAATGSARMVRGGSWSDYGSDCRSAARSVDYPAQKSFLIGFRVVAAPIPP